VEDCAQAHGAASGGRKAGSWGRGCLLQVSTRPRTWSAGRCGAITDSDTQLADKVRSLRQYGWSSKYQCGVWPNSRHGRDAGGHPAAPKLPTWTAGMRAAARSPPVRTKRGGAGDRLSAGIWARATLRTFYVIPQAGPASESRGAKRPRHRNDIHYRSRNTCRGRPAQRPRRRSASGDGEGRARDPDPALLCGVARRRDSRRNCGLRALSQESRVG